ncbi:MAG: methyltransferase, FkbM family [Chloroflexi bacterium]|jgi:FkbM family methyltransferase|nr:methyltransferase, FkbM family [Chloroflexota bacterium]
MSYLKSLAPEGLVRLLEYKKRFASMGLPGSNCLKRSYRKAVDITNLNMLPAEIRNNLKCVVDVGANVGEWSTGVALLTKAPKIIAFEPVPHIFRELVTNTRDYPQIECINSALGSKPGQVDMFVERLHKLSSILPIRDELRPVHGIAEDKPQTVSVPLQTLDNALSREDEISLLKLDVQGYEPEVLAGGRAVLQRTRVLITEVVYVPYYQGDVQFGTLHNQITSLAPFKLYGISAPSCTADGQPMWADAIYIQN